MTVVAADIGGTHARFALVRDGGIHHSEKLEAARFATLADALATYCTGHGLKPGGTVLIAAAARAEPDGIWRFLNGPNARPGGWVIDRAALKNAGWDVSILVNDFAASAQGAPTLDPADLTVLKPGAGMPGAPRAILGPGTGLGMALLFPQQKGWRVQETFGGHMLAAAATEEQADILARVRAATSMTVVPETLVSGRGLPALYRAVCARNNRASHLSSADELLAHTDDADVKDTLRLFHEFLGLFAHNVAVTAHAFDGIYLDGGVIQRLHEAGLYDAAAFDRALTVAAADSVARALAQTPVWLVRDPFVALRGLAVMAAGDAHA